MTKTCTRCQMSLPISDFSPKKGRPGQAITTKSWCKPCVNENWRLKYGPTDSARRKKVKENPQIRPTDIADPSVTVRLCNICQELKPLTDFHPCSKNPTRLWHWASHCKTCDAAYHRNRAANGYRRPEPDLALRLIESKLKNVNQRNHSSMRQNGFPGRFLDFTLTVAYLREIIENQTVSGKLICAVTGIPLLPDSKNHPLSPSIDRIDNTKGYVPGNVRVVALLYNVARRHWDDSMVLDIISQMASCRALMT